VYKFGGELNTPKQYKTFVSKWVHDHFVFKLQSRKTHDAVTISADVSNFGTYEYRNFLPGLLDGVPLAARECMWFIRVGASPHVSLVTQDALNRTSRNRRIHLRSPHAHLTWILDFCVWGHWKVLTFLLPPVNDVEGLQQRTVTGCKTVCNIPAPENVFDIQRCDVSRQVPNVTGHIFSGFYNCIRNQRALTLLPHL
jgi:hypothetical protein